MIAADISSDDLIANAGGAYQYGIVARRGSWNAWIIYSLLIWIFLPYYVRSGIYTMPQFLERRYNSTCRYIFAVALVVGYVAAILGGTLYAGGLSLQSMLDMNLTWAIIFFGVTTGAYTIYGGLTSAAWTDFLQVVPAPHGRHPHSRPRPAARRRARSADARVPAEVPGLPPADARALSRHRRVHRLPHRRHLV